MSNTIGTSVGVWNTNNQEKFLNVSGKPFYKSRLNFRTVNSQLGINYKEYIKRGLIFKDLKDNLGLSEFQINSFYDDWQVRGNSGSEGFKDFILNQLLLQEAKLKEEERLLEQLKKEEKDKVLSDLNILDNEPHTLDAELPNSLEKKKSNTTKYILYIGIALAVSVTGYILYKRK